MASGMAPTCFDVTPWTTKFGWTGQVELGLKTQLIDVPASPFKPPTGSMDLFDILEHLAAKREMGFDGLKIVLKLCPLPISEFKKCNERVKRLSILTEHDQENIDNKVKFSIKVSHEGFKTPSILTNSDSAKPILEVRFFEDSVLLSFYDENQNPIMIVLEYEHMSLQMFVKLKAKVIHSSKYRSWETLIKPIDDFSAFSEFSDVILQSKDKIQIPAHRFILGAKSERFWRLLQNGKTCDENGVLRVGNVNAKPLMAILYWIYTDQIPNNVVQMFPEVLKAARVFQLNGFIKAVDDRMIRFSNSKNITKPTFRSNLYSLGVSLKRTPGIVKRRINGVLNRNTRSR